jgi:uncharacterized protein YbjT (DUF2867 family)
MTGASRVIAVCGATGRQGGAVVRSLLPRGWTVRALTRKPDRAKVRSLQTLGAQPVSADMDEPESLRAAFDGADAVFSVQNGITSGFDREIAQGRNVADAARAADVRHLVYASAGPGRSGAGTGVPSWEAKVPIEDHIRGLGVPFTILRPTAFMELMTDRSFYPAVGTWRIWPRLTGTDRKIPWLSVGDVGAVAATVLADPQRFDGRDLPLAADVRTLEECRAIYRDVVGHDPRTFPMPQFLFDRFTKGDPSALWRWLRTGEVSAEVEGTRDILPSARSVRDWLQAKRAPNPNPGPGTERRGTNDPSQQ